MWSLVKKYTETLAYHNSSNKAIEPEQQVIVLTGATGALGAHILAQLASLPSVTKVYALVRATDDINAAERVASSIKQRRITTVDDTEAQKIIALASNIDRPDLGLTPKRYAEIRDTVTGVIAVSFVRNLQAEAQLKIVLIECLVCQF